MKLTQFDHGFLHSAWIAAESEPELATASDFAIMAGTLSLQLDDTRYKLRFWRVVAGVLAGVSVALAVWSAQ